MLAAANVTIMGKLTFKPLPLLADLESSHRAVVL